MPFKPVESMFPIRAEYQVPHQFCWLLLLIHYNFIMINQELQIPLTPKLTVENTFFRKSIIGLLESFRGLLNSTC